MANILKTPTFQASRGYNGFDMSFVNKFSSTTGELLPVFYDLLQPGDKVRCNSFIKTRTMPIKSAAFANIHEHVEWFFVPIEQIYSSFPEFYYGINDPHTSAIDFSHLGMQFPFLTRAEFNAAIQNMGASNNGIDAFSVPRSGLRLLEMFNIPWSEFLSDDLYSLNLQGSPYSINPMFFAAYQKIYSDFYRIQDREDPDVHSWNFDDSVNIGGSNFVSRVCKLRYRPARRDFFTNNFIAPLAGGTSQYSMLTSDGGYNLTETFQQWLQSSSDYVATNPTASTDSQNITQVIPANVGGSFDLQRAEQALSPAGLRTSFALEKLLSVTARAGKTYDAQTLAHFGVRVPVTRHDKVQVLGSQHSDIVIGEVIATASGTASDGDLSSTSVLGEIAGKGYGANGDSKPFTFEAKCHGILMAIYSCEPELDYLSTGFDKMHQFIDRYSWFTPEYENLGMQPLFRYQGICSASSSGNDAINNARQGWQYRYSELKTKWNQIHGALQRSLSYWTVNRTPFLYTNTLANYLVSPYALDSIMLTKYQPFAVDDAGKVIPNSGFSFDPLIHQLYLDVKKSSKMSAYGLPQL